MSRIYHILSHNVIMEGDLSLKPVQDSDIEYIRCWRNEQMKILRQSSIISPEQQINYFKNYVWPEMTSNYPKQILFSYFHRRDLIGYGGLVNIAWRHKRAEVSFLLSPHVGKNSNQYADYFLIFLQMIISVAFNDLDLERLFTETYAFRKLHISVLEDAHFQLEGVLRHHVRIDNIPIDSVIHGCLRSSLLE